MTTFINQSVSADSISNDKFIFDDVDGYFVIANVGDVSQNTITFGNGTADLVSAAGDVSQNTITFGNGFDDSVTTTFGNVSQNTITFGDNTDGLVSAASNVSHNTITFGNGPADEVAGGLGISHNTITFGNGDNDAVVTETDNADSSHDTITFGNGNNDSMQIPGSVDHDTITFGNGSNDLLLAQRSSHDLIIVGNGNNDQIMLNFAFSGTAIGADTIITGTGSFDAVVVAAHTQADTFGFSLGTNGASFTTITGAQAGDHVAVGSGAGIVRTDPNGLGSTLIQASTTATDLASYISSLGPLTNGDTYVGFNETSKETFIVTGTQSGHTGAVEIVGQAFDHNNIAGHVLTLA